MPRPTTKADLLAASHDSFAKVLGLVEAMSPEKREATFAFEDRDRCVRDVLVHLHEWHHLLVTWVEANMGGHERAFLPDGYTWTTYAPLNVAFRDKHAETTLDEALALVQASRVRVRQLIEEFSDEELFTKKHFRWTGTTSLGAYCVSATVSHDEWAAKKLRKHARSA